MGLVTRGSYLAGYYDFKANISFTFEAIKNLSAHPTFLRFGLFCNLGVVYSFFLED